MLGKCSTTELHPQPLPPFESGSCYVAQSGLELVVLLILKCEIVDECHHTQSDVNVLFLFLFSLLEFWQQINKKGNSPFLFH